MSQAPPGVSDGATRSDISGHWRITRAVRAPWLRSDASSQVRELVGQVIRVSSDRLDGPPPLRCNSPRLLPTRSAPEGLFQGNLPEPAAAGARTLGFAEGEVDGVRIECDAGTFDAHWADSVSLLLALDNMILTLDRSPGSSAASGSPAALVQQFLETHFAGRMAFEPSTMAAKRLFLTDAFASTITRYFATPTSPDEAPVVDGDLFTDSQEYPTRFSVLAGSVIADSATVAVRFSDGYVGKTLTYQLRRQSGAWRIDDVRDVNGSSLRTILH